MMEATVHDKIISLKFSRSGPVPEFMFVSMVFARRGAWNPFAVLEISTRMLNKAKETAILPVLIPTILTEYDNVVIRFIRKVRQITRMILLSIVLYFTFYFLPPTLL